MLTTLWVRLLHFHLILMMLVATLGTPRPAPAQAKVYTFSNGVQMASAVKLPIFKIDPLPVNSQVTLLLTQQFSGIYFDNLTPLQDGDQQRPRFVALNEKNQTVLEQFTRTGGFYAYSPDRAFGVDPFVGAVLDPAAAQRFACLFLLNKQALAPASGDVIIPGQSIKCDNNFTTNPLYPVSIQTRATMLNEPGAKISTTPLRIMVVVPMLINASAYERGAPNIPLGGPGGHISFLFNDTSPASNSPSLDSGIPGLQALAMPAFGRNFTFLRSVTIQDPASVRQSLETRLADAYPGSTVKVPDPAIVYSLDEPNSPQQALEPEFLFEDVSVTLPGGETLNLRDFPLPAADGGEGGLGPSVTITAPLNNFIVLPNQKVSLQGEVKFGTAPYSYQWLFEDGAELGSGVLDAAGAVPPVNTTLPGSGQKEGDMSALTLRLRVTDADGVTREDTVHLLPPYGVYLPALAKNVTLQTTGGPAAAVAPAETNAVSAINYSFGVEYGSDYPPYGPGGSDLPGVIPDAGGLSAGLMGLGWPRRFNWYNSLAWEKDWRDCSLGGIDCTFGVDRADFVYYAGHGGKGGLSMPSSSHDSGWADGSNARFQSARWVGFASCQTLRAQEPVGVTPAITRWFGSFKGAHLLMGFNSNMADVAFGGPLVANMRMPTFPFIGDLPWAQNTIAGAWVKTAFDLHAGKPAYLFAVRGALDPSKEKLPKVDDPLRSRPNPPDAYVWVWWNE